MEDTTKAIKKLKNQKKHLGVGCQTLSVPGPV